MRRPSWRARVVLLLTALAAIPAYLALRSMYQTSTMSWPRRSFVGAEWRDSSRTDRFRFFKDLRDRHALDRLARAEVAQLLGPPDFDGGRYWSYVLKGRSEREYSFNAVYLMDVRFSEDGRVESVSVRSD